MLLTALLAEYRGSLAVGGLSPQTIRNYCMSVALFIRFLSEAGPPSVRDCKRETINAWLSTRLHLASNTIAGDIMALRSFCHWLVSRRLLTKNPTRHIPLPRRRRPAPRFIAEEDIARLREGFYVGTRGRLVHAVIELLYASGLRIFELVALDLEDINFAENAPMVTVKRGKGGKGRTVPIGESVGALERWLEVRGEWALPGEQAVFVSNRRQRICRETLEKLIRDYAVIVLGKRVTPHQLRHSFGKHMVDHGADLRAVQETLGHASLATTQIYTYVSGKHLLETYNRCHPMGKKGGSK